MADNAQSQHVERPTAWLARRGVLGPAQGRIYGNPFDERPLQKPGGIAGGPLAKHQQVGIAEVANHFVGGHFSPPPRVARSQRGEVSLNRLAAEVDSSV
jgi:hypothetical protein